LAAVLHINAPNQTPSDYPGLVVVAVLVQNMLESHTHLLKEGH